MTWALVGYLGCRNNISCFDFLWLWYIFSDGDGNLVTADNTLNVKDCACQMWRLRGHQPDAGPASLSSLAASWSRLAASCSSLRACSSFSEASWSSLSSSARRLRAAVRQLATSRL